MISARKYSVFSPFNRTDVLKLCLYKPYLVKKGVKMRLKTELVFNYQSKNFRIIKKTVNFAVAKSAARGVAQLAARHVRDVEVGSSSLLTPTKQDNLSDH